MSDVSDPVLALEGLDAGYDERRGRARPRPDRRAGRGRRAARRQRRGQDHDAARRSRACSGRSAGDVRFDGEDIAGVSPPSARAAGIAHVPEGRGLFFGLTVAEHFRLAHRGRAARRRDRLRATSRRCASCRTGGPACCPAASSRCSRSAARSRARPKVLLLDELSLGLAPVIVERLLPVVRRCAGGRAAPCCSSSSTSTSRSRSPTAATSCPTARSWLHRSAEELRGDRACSSRATWASSRRRRTSSRPTDAHGDDRDGARPDRERSARGRRSCTSTSSSSISRSRRASTRTSTRSPPS